MSDECACCSGDNDSCSVEKIEVSSRSNQILKSLAIPLIGSLLFIVALALGKFALISAGLFIAAYALTGAKVLYRAARNLIKGKVFDENFLMAIATLGAIAIGEFGEATAVMIFYTAGEFLQNLAVKRSRKSISDLMEIKPDIVNLIIDDSVRIVSPYEVVPGDLIRIKPGERVPLDGTVVAGASTLDMKALTGEALPVDISIGESILSGSINLNALLEVKVSKAYGESTVKRILDLVEGASFNKSETENFITKFAKFYTPVVVIVAVLLAIIPPLITGQLFETWIHRALVFLVVSCPCALVISIPLSFFAGIGKAASRGILFKGANFLEALNSAKTVVFDKTGTLTHGAFEVAGIYPENAFTEHELLEIAASAEYHSNHPAAKSIVRAHCKDCDIDVSKDMDVNDHKEFSGYGVRTIVKGRTVIAGNERFMSTSGVEVRQYHTDGTVVYVAVDGQYAGAIVIADIIKDDSYKAVRDLRERGVESIFMLTGDRKSSAARVSAELGLDGFYAELLPDGKIEELQNLENNIRIGDKLVYVGDGINDAPILARVDIGVAMGGIGSDAAIEAADIVLMTDEPSKLAEAIDIASATRRIVIQNIALALSTKGVVLLLGAIGLADMWAAVFADVGVTLLAVLNSMRMIHSIGIKRS